MMSSRQLETADASGVANKMVERLVRCVDYLMTSDGIGRRCCHGFLHPRSYQVRVDGVFQQLLTVPEPVNGGEVRGWAHGVYGCRWQSY